VRALIDRHFERPLPLRVLADEVGLHPVTLVRLFRDDVGIPPHAYVIERRVEAAQALVAAGVDLVDAAMRVGFCDQSHLHRHFKALTGMTPASFARLEGAAASTGRR
jgi:AraC-like DNA-binding protein